MIKNSKNITVEKNNPFAFLFRFAILLSFLQSLNAWFLWNINPLLIPALTIAFFAIYVQSTESSVFSFTWKNTLMLTLLIVAKTFCTSDDSYFNSLFPLVPVAFALYLRPYYKLILLKFLTDSVALILGLSLVVWVLLLLGLPLPNLGKITHPAWNMYVFNNYIICLRNNLIYDIRFCSIFLEPGHVGMISAFLLFANRFNFKNRSVLILLAAVAFTLSLAAYVLLLLSYSLYSFLYSNKRVSYTLGWAIALLSIYLFFSNWNGGDNVVNNLIISRLEYDNTKGDIVGNNRFSQNLDDFYGSFILKDQAWFGIGTERYRVMDFGPNSGYKVFLLQFGILGILLVFLFYFSVAFNNKSKFSFALLTVFVVAFLQRAYPFWTCELLIFVSAMPMAVYYKDYESFN